MRGGSGNVWPTPLSDGIIPLNFRGASVTQRNASHVAQPPWRAIARSSSAPASPVHASMARL